MDFRQVHLDFHTSEDIPNIGKRFDKENFQKALIEGCVNSITLFSKCHHGWAYHPSETNEIHPHLDFDLLRAQIEAAHEIGVKTSIYLSAGLDEKMARRHPEWLVRKKDESTLYVDDFTQAGYHKFCMNSPYLQYLLSQIEEACSKYEADEIMLDITGVQPCWCQNCVRSLIENGKDPYDEKNINELAEQTYVNYAKSVRKVVDNVKPGLPIFHNGGNIIRGRRDFLHLNTHLVIESLPTGGWGYDYFPVTVKYCQTLGMDMVAMTGKFHTGWGEFGGFKHKNAIRYETSLAIANGAKCSIGDQLLPNGEMDIATYKLIGSSYKEIERKEPWLDYVTPIADIGVLCVDRTNDTSIQKSKLISNSEMGASRILSEGKYLYNFIDAQDDFSKYKVIVLTDLFYGNPEVNEKIKNFIKSGGKVLASGKAGVDPLNHKFIFDFGANYIAENEYSPDYFRPCFDIEDMDNTSYVFYSRGEKIELTDGIELAKRENPYFNRTAMHFCSHLHTPNSGVYGGPGMVEGNDGIYIAWQIFDDYATNGSLILKRAVCYALDKLLANDKTLKTNLPAQGIVTLMNQEKERRYINHLLYASPVKRGNGIEVIEDILPIYNTHVSIKLPSKIKEIYLAPQMEKIEFTQHDDVVSYTVPVLECHQMVVLDYI